MAMASSHQRLSGSIQHRARTQCILARAAAMAIVGVAAGTANAQNVWVGPVGTPSAWETSANWSAGSVPNGEVAFVNNGGIATISSSVPETLALQVGSDAGFTGNVVQQAGSGLNLTQVLVLGGSANTAPTTGGIGTYTMNGGTLSDTDNFVGSKGAGTFNMNGGTLISTGHMRLGDDEGSRGVLNQTGGAITLPGFLLVGHFSPANSPNITMGTYNMSGGTLTVANLNLGQHPNARGEVDQTGGWVQNTGNVVIAETSRQANLYNLSGGTLRCVNGATVIAGSSNGIGEFRVSATGNAQIDGRLFMGSGMGSLSAVGTFDMSGGTVAPGLNKPGG